MKPKTKSSNTRTIYIVLASVVILSIIVLIIRHFNSKSSGDIGGSDSDYAKAADKLASYRNFKFKQACVDLNGDVDWYKSSTITDPESGILLACEKRVVFGQPEVIVASELDDIKSKIASGVYAPKTEKDRLALYFKIVYPNADPSSFDAMTADSLIAMYQDLEMYYHLPSSILPQTTTAVRRSAGTKFFEIPSGITLEQSPFRKGITTPFIEVTRAGSNASFLNNPVLFNGTYYYPAKGSGVYIPLGETLIAYNKAHALKMLQVPNNVILSIAGVDFQSFLQADSEKMWAAILKSNPKAVKSSVFVQACVADKHATAQDPACSPILGKMTRSITYIPAALDAIIAEMVTGKCLRLRRSRTGTGTTKVYYGIGDTSDLLVAQLARDRGYNTIQLLREAQMSLSNDAIVGNELLHLIEPVYSQTYMTRLDPLNRPATVPSNPYQPKVNYLLDPSIPPVDPSMISNGQWDPNTTPQNVFDVLVTR